MTLNEIYCDYFGPHLRPRPLWLLVCVMLGAVPLSFVTERLKRAA